MITTAVFLVAAAAAILGGVGVVMARNPVHSAVMLVGTLFSVAVLFVLQEAHFLAAIQVIVYAGAIVVLFLFVIMLLGVDRHEVLEERLKGQRLAAWLLGLVVLGGLSLLLVSTQLVTGSPAARGAAQGVAGKSNVEGIAESLFTDFLWPFEITSALLVIAVVGAVVLVRRTSEDGGRVESERTGSEGPA